MTKRDRLAVAALAKLNGQPVARCPHCGAWKPVVDEYVITLCRECGDWFNQWNIVYADPHSSDYMWAVATEYDG